MLRERVRFTCDSHVIRMRFFENVIGFRKLMGAKRLLYSVVSLMSVRSEINYEPSKDVVKLTTFHYQIHYDVISYYPRDSLQDQR